MQLQLRCSYCAAAAAALVCVSLLAPAAVRADGPAKVEGPLATYVAKDDDSYEWKKIRGGKLGSVEYAELILTSQTWRDIVWKHQLHILKPSSAPADCKQAVLFIAGGRWRDELDDPTREASPPREAAILTALAEQLKTPVAVLQHVPFQPMFGGLVEDEIISLTFEQFLRTGDTEWPLLLPMVKSAVRGMDAAQEFSRQEWGLEIESFTVTGASKRGWTTWLTGAVDARATAIAPMVIDTLNMTPQMKHQLFSWGKYSEQIEDYTRRGIQQHMDTPLGRTLQAIVDPYAYRSQLNQPKLLIMGTNDRYWPLDALNLYWDALNGQKYILYVPNNGHGIRDFRRVVGSLTALHRHATGEQSMPQLQWEFEASPDVLELSIESEQDPDQVNIWLAESDSRDFRESEWRSVEAKKNGDGWEYSLPIPSDGYAAMFGEAVYGNGAFPLFLSTNVRIVHTPDAKSK